MNIFSTIGTPKIISDKKIKKSMKACCVFSEISIMEYKWVKTNLVLIDSLSIENYPNNKKKEHFKNIDGKIELIEKTVVVEKDFVNNLLDEF